MDIKSYGNYIHRNNELIDELKGSLTKEEILYLKESIKETGKPHYWKVYNDSIEVIDRYVRMTDSQRKKTKKFQDLDTKIFLVLASIHYLQRSSAFMIAVQKSLNSTYETGYRAVAAVAGKGYADLQEYKFDFWPF